MRHLCLLFLVNTAVVAFTTPLHQRRDWNADGKLNNSACQRTKSGLLHQEKRLPENHSPNSHLLSFEMSKKISYNTAFLFALKTLLHRFTSPALLSSLHCSLEAWQDQNAGVFTKLILLPLLSSSCCSLQLIINAITGIGCAGFNTFLGPLRSYFMSALLFSTISSITKKKSDFLRILLSWFVALTPEIVQFLNKKRREKLPGRRSINTHGLECKLKLQIRDMGCVACIQKIESTLWNSFPDNIVDAVAWLHKDKNRKGGEAKVTIKSSSESETEDIIQGIICKIEESGFNCNLTSKVH